MPGAVEEGAEAAAVVELRAPVVAAMTMTMTTMMMMMMTVVVVQVGVEAELEAGPPRVVGEAPRVLEVGQRGVAEAQWVAEGTRRGLHHDRGSERRPMVSNSRPLKR